MIRALTGLLMFGLCAAMSLPATARSEDTGNDRVGCGVGPMIFKNRSEPLIAIAASVVNVFIPNTFGMSSGTWGCDSTTVVQAEPERFIASNLDLIARDAARGGGEHLDATASLLGVRDSRAFSARVAQQFDRVFADPAPHAVHRELAALIH